MFLHGTSEVDVVAQSCSVGCSQQREEVALLRTALFVCTEIVDVVKNHSLAYLLCQCHFCQSKRA